MSPHLLIAFNPSIRRRCASLTLVALGTVSACAPKPATPAPAPTATPPSATVSQTCPEPSAGPSIIVQAVEDARRAMVANPAGPVPPACLVTAFVRIPVVVPDSLI